jgi:putative hydrolase of the HAD superfamily
VAGAVNRSIAAVVFDLYGTLVPEFSRSDFSAALQSMSDVLGGEAEAFRKGWDETAMSRQTGAFHSIQDNVRAVCTRLGLSPTDEAMERACQTRLVLYRRWFRPRPGAVETLRELKSRGFPIALVSMCAPDTPGFWRASELAPFVDVEVFSSETGLRKPDPAIYHLAAERLGVEPSQCLYCGDGAYGELTGAAAVGMAAYLIRDPDVDPAEMLRPEGEDWTGASVSDLRQLLPLLPSLAG